jgi:hypothetical protein
LSEGEIGIPFPKEKTMGTFDTKVMHHTGMPHVEAHPAGTETETISGSAPFGDTHDNALCCWESYWIDLGGEG